MTGAKPLRIRLDKVDGLIRIYGETRYLVLLGCEKIDFIYNRIRYLIGVKNGIMYVISHSYAKVKVDSYDSLPLEKTLTLHNVIIFIKSVFNKDKISYDNEMRQYICFCINHKYYIMIKLTFLKEVMLIAQANQKSVIFVTNSIF